MKTFVAATTASAVIIIVIIASLIGVAGFGLYKYRGAFIPNRPDTTAVIATTVIGNSTYTTTLTIFQKTSTGGNSHTSGITSITNSIPTTFYTTNTSTTQSEFTSLTTTSSGSSSFPFVLQGSPNVVVQSGSATLTAVYYYVSNDKSVVVYGDVYTSFGQYVSRSGQSVDLNSTSSSMTVHFNLGFLESGAYYVNFYVINLNGTQLSRSADIPFTV